MAIFSDKVVTAKFIDPPHNMTIELLYKEDDIVVPYVLEVDFTQQDFNDLINEISLEQILKNTVEYVNREKEKLNTVINAEIEKRWAVELKKIENAWKEIDVYAESEKSKKMEEVKVEFNKLKQDLNSQFNSSDTIAKLEPKNIFYELTNKENDNDFVFNLKVAILEDPIIAKSKDKDIKLAIRKAKTVTQLLNVYYSQKAV